MKQQTLLSLCHSKLSEPRHPKHTRLSVQLPRKSLCSYVATAFCTVFPDICDLDRTNDTLFAAVQLISLPNTSLRSRLHQQKRLLAGETVISDVAPVSPPLILNVRMSQKASMLILKHRRHCFPHYRFALSVNSTSLTNIAVRRRKHLR